MRLAAQIVTITICTCACLLGSRIASADATFAEQRELFRHVYPSAELGDWSAFEKLDDRQQRMLRDYVLWPELRATYYKATVRTADHGEIEAYLDAFGTLKPARELRYRYALHLARVGDLDSYLDFYRSFYQGSAVARLDCLALQAELEGGRGAVVTQRALDLWLVGESQVDECDPVFEWLQEAGKLTATEYRQRFELAVEKRNFNLARWLGRSIDEQHVAVATSWIRAQGNPEGFVRGHRKLEDNDATRKQLAYAIERITYSDPILANELWQKVRRRFAFSEKQKLLTERHIALWVARDRLPGAHGYLRRLPQAAQNDEVSRWRARTSLRKGKWKTLLQDIAAMSSSERSSEEWRYWRAIALLRTGQADSAKKELESLASERSYYGFLAADEIGAAYALDHNGSRSDEEIIASILAKPEIIRARELFHVGLDGRGRSEWDSVVAYMTDDEKMQAAILADRWGWHSRAISTVASVGEYDDLTLRYPLAFAENFKTASQLASIPPTWAYGIARSESLFMRDVRSSAGAIGLMQLMPSTGKRVAKSIALPYSGLNTLTNPESNIRLGTSYLGQMAERFGGNRVLATAAYNAGPHRVDEWLPQRGALDARVWIEIIPFNETRNYVRRVLAAETIFHWRMTGQTRRLSPLLQPISASATEQLASR